MSSQATPGAMPSHNAPSPEVATDQVLCAACGETGAAPLDLRGAPLVPKCGHVLCRACVQELAYSQGFARVGVLLHRAGHRAVSGLGPDVSVMKLE